jgi:hypothetical protein
MLLTVLIAVVLGPLLGGVIVALAGLALSVLDSSCCLWTEGLSYGGRLIIFIVAGAYISFTPIALAAGIFVALWILWKPPTLGIVIAAALLASVGHAVLWSNTINVSVLRDDLVIAGASVVASVGCWFLTRRFARFA